MDQLLQCSLGWNVGPVQRAQWLCRGSELDLDCRGNRAKSVGHLSGWINLPDIGERSLADFGKIGEFGKIARRSWSDRLPV